MKEDSKHIIQSEVFFKEAYGTALLGWRILVVDWDTHQFRATEVMQIKNTFVLVPGLIS